MRQKNLYLETRLEEREHAIGHLQQALRSARNRASTADIETARRNRLTRGLSSTLNRLWNGKEEDEDEDSPSFSEKYQVEELEPWRPRNMDPTEEEWVPDPEAEDEDEVNFWSSSSSECSEELFEEPPPAPRANRIKRRRPF